MWSSGPAQVTRASATWILLPFPARTSRARRILRIKQLIQDIAEPDLEDIDLGRPNRRFRRPVVDDPPRGQVVLGRATSTRRLWRQVVVEIGDCAEVEAARLGKMTAAHCAQMRQPRGGNMPSWRPAERQVMARRRRGVIAELARIGFFDSAPCLDGSPLARLIWECCDGWSVRPCLRPVGAAHGPLAMMPSAKLGPDQKHGLEGPLARWVLPLPGSTGSHHSFVALPEGVGA